MKKRDTDKFCICTGSGCSIVKNSSNCFLCIEIPRSLITIFIAYLREHFREICTLIADENTTRRERKKKSNIPTHKEKSPTPGKKRTESTKRRESRFNEKKRTPRHSLLHFENSSQMQRRNRINARRDTPAALSGRGTSTYLLGGEFLPPRLFLQYREEFVYRRAF